MAQAPGGSTGAPRQNDTVKDFRGMQTQNQRNAIPKGSFAWLENIQPIGPGNLHSIPGRARSATTHVPPLDVCPDQFPSEATTLSVGCCYDSNGFGDLTGNDCGMFAHADADGDFWHTASLNSGFGSGPYPAATPTRTWYLLKPQSPGDTTSPLNCTLIEDTPLTLPGGRTANFQSTQTPQAGICGWSDEKIYLLRLNTVSPLIFPIANGPGFIGFPGVDNGQFVFTENHGVTVIYSSDNSGPDLGNWFCKFDDSFYTRDNVLASPRVVRYPLADGLFTYQTIRDSYTNCFPGWDDGTCDHLNGLRWMTATTDFLYALVVGPFNDQSPIVTELRLYKLNRDDLTFVRFWVLTGDPNFPGAWGMHAKNDQLIFLVQGGDGANDWKIGWFQTTDETTHVFANTIAQQCTEAGNLVGPPGQSGFFYAGGFFYLSYSGFGLGTTNVLRIGEVTCPSNPAIPF